MLVSTCPADNFDASTQTCSEVQWVEYDGGLPPLSLTDGVEISGAILGCWAIGYTIRSFVAAIRKG
jgi:hypothetical protein